jgi:hypothetical protein
MRRTMMLGEVLVMRFEDLVDRFTKRRPPMAADGLGR